MLKAKETVMGGHYSPEEFTRLNKQAEITWEARGTEIGEALCILVGNTMLKDMEKGVLLGEQLRPIFELCKLD